MKWNSRTAIQDKSIAATICFLVITFIISAGIFIWIFNSNEENMVAILAMMFTPGISAVITKLIFRQSLKTFAWKPGKLRYLLLAFLLPFVVSVIGYGLFWITQYSEFSAMNVVNYKWAKMIGFELPAPFLAGFFAKLLIASPLTALIVFGEELGWSGFLTPKLRKRFSIPVTSVIVGLIWAVWHFPAIIGGVYGHGTPLWISLPGFSLVLIGASFVRTVVVDRSESLWPGVVLHASHNVVLMGMFREMTKQTGDLDIHCIVSETGPFLGLIYIIISVIFWRLMVKKKKENQ